MYSIVLSAVHFGKEKITRQQTPMFHKRNTMVEPIKSSDLFEKYLFNDVISESKKLIKDLDSIEERIGKISNHNICKWSFLGNGKPINDIPTNPFPSLFVYEPPKEIKKVSTILMQCEKWVNTNEHEMASIYYEIMANECKKLSEEHKRSIKSS